MDYAEGISRLADLTSVMQSVNANGHRFRFVATCQSGALPSVKDALNEIKAEVRDLTDQPTEHYNDWVVRKILAYGEVPNAEPIAQICSHMPVLAAFAFFLYRHYQRGFDRQFSDIHRDDNFADWIEKRLRLALKDRHIGIEEVGGQLAAMALRLPLDEERYLPCGE